ncbi:CMGC/CDK/CRK7 protein kinase [Rhizoctonia solani AG-1 IA]|uniref:[RNA-polymerase]-subunit kinase n=1 Tax=Thanatephorus cucumeris (strain AG1-IA) TaxID=983506 RepID=L8X8R6_THACA|nr:CMGC/CDK/CRK7 protein kinase [Rhizoctonia solani AG-1 IA]
MDESWESSSRKRARAEPDEYRRDHLAYEHGSHSLPREHLRRTPDHYTTDPQPWEMPQSTILNQATTILPAPSTPLTVPTALVHPTIAPCRAPTTHASIVQIHRSDMKVVSGYHEMPLPNGVNHGPPNRKNHAQNRPLVWATGHGQRQRGGPEKIAKVQTLPVGMSPVILHHPVPISPKQRYTIGHPIIPVQAGVMFMIATIQVADVTRMEVPAAWGKGGVSVKFVVTEIVATVLLNGETRIRLLSDVRSYSPPAEPRGVSKRRHSSYSPSPSRKTDRSRSPVRSISRTPSRSKSRSPARSWHRTRTPSRSRSRSRSISSRSLDSRSRSRSRSPGRRRTAINRPRSRSPDRWDYRNKKRKNQRGGNDYVASDKRVRRDRSADSLRQHSRRRSVSTASTRSRSDSGESERRRTEAAKRPVHRLPESSRSKALENSPTAPQRLNGFNQQKPRPPSSPVSFRAPNAMSRALAPETDTPATEITAALANGLHLPTSTIPTGPRSMAQVSQPQINSHPDVAVVSPNKPLTTSPITLKVQQSKAPSRTVKMFFPGDEDEEEAPGGAESSSRSTNLVPPVKDKDSGLTLPPGSQKSEFIPAKDHSTSGVPPVADLSPQRRLNGVPGPSVSTSPKSTFTSTQQAPITPSLARVARDEDYKTAASMPPGPMPPSSAPGSSPAVPNNTGGTTTPIRISTQTSPAFAPENKVLRAVSSSSSTIPRRPPNIPKTASEYQIICQVGEGTFGKVYKARSLANPDARVALKRIRMEGEKDGFPVTAMREIKLLQSLRHENVINLHEMMVSKGTWIYLPTSVQGPHLKSLCAQMLSGLAYLHQKSVIHRDMKGSNILLNNYGELKLADFGLARFYSKRRRSDYTNRVITLWYRPPELLLGATVYGPEVDMWSAGCIMLELFTTKPAFQGNDEIHQLDAIARIMGTPNIEIWPGLTDMPWFELVKSTEPVKSHFRSIFNKYLSPAALDLAELLLAYDPNKRATAVQALQAPYFVSEDPPPEKPVGLATIEGEWHEYESKREREKLRKKRKVEGQHQQHQQ